jgi:hypothetical protein
VTDRLAQDFADDLQAALEQFTAIAEKLKGSPDEESRPRWIGSFPSAAVGSLCPSRAGIQICSRAGCL